MRPFDLLQPTTLDEALGLLRQHGDDARPLGGGVMLAPLLRERLLAPRCLISLTEIPDLCELSTDERSMRLGAAVTLRNLERSAVVRSRWPLLTEAARLVGNVRVRNVATVGGHLAQADPHLDLPPVLTALGAEADLRSAASARTVPIADFFRGYYESVLAPDELIVGLRVPDPPPGLQGVYLKYCALSPNDWPTVGVAACLRAEAGRATDVRIVVGSVAERPLRLPEAEALLEEERWTATALAEVARRYANAADPIPDASGSVAYKRRVTEVYVRRAALAAARRAGLAVGDGLA